MGKPFNLTKKSGQVLDAYKEMVENFDDILFILDEELNIVALSNMAKKLFLEQAGEENTGGQKSQWNNGISVKKRRSIKDKQRSANNCKRFIPVINFHVLKRIYWWLRHCLMNP